MAKNTARASGDEAIETQAENVESLARARREAVAPPFPVCSAARAGDVQGLLVLLASGADVDERSAGGWTPAMLAVAEGHRDCLRELLAAGCDLAARASTGVSLLALAGSYRAGEDAALIEAERARREASAIAGELPGSGPGGARPRL